jgi:dedicator of cytokinesis protein 9/10/11
MWIDSEKQLFRCNITLDSTVLTRDTHLQNLFSHAEKLVQPQIGSMPPETETCKILKAAHAIQLTTLIQFLPTIFNQLFEVLAMVQGTSDVGVQVVRLMVHLVHMICDIGRKDLMDSYIKYVFLCVGNGVHEHLMAPLHSFIESSQQDFLLGHKFMQHSHFFFQIINKSMAQYLINTGRIKVFGHIFMKVLHSFMLYVIFRCVERKDSPRVSMHTLKS